MARTLGILAFMLLGTTVAEASIKLCMNKRDERIAVPVDPVLVIPRESVRQFSITRVDGRVVHFTATPLDELWARVHIKAPAGVELTAPSLSDHCNVRSVTLVTTGWTRDDRAPTGVSASQDADSGWLTIAHDTAAEMARMRVEWAYSRADLAAGLHGTRIEAPRGTARVTRLGIAARPGFDLMFVRLTPLLLDGSSGQPWNGWIHRDPATGALTASDGPPPAERSANAPTCAPQAPWVAGERPTFAYEGHQRTFHATTNDGRVLRTTVADRDGFVGFESTTDVTVVARAGDAFQLDVLPRGSACPLDVVVKKGASTPRVVVRSRNVDVSTVTGPFTDDERHRHGLDRNSATGLVRHRIHVDGSTSTVAIAYGNTSWRGENHQAVANGAINIDASDGIEDWQHLPSPRFGRHGLRVVMAPVRDGFRARGCELWLLRDVKTGDVTMHASAASQLRARKLDSCLTAKP